MDNSLSYMIVLLHFTCEKMCTCILITEYENDPINVQPILLSCAYYFSHSKNKMPGNRTSRLKVWAHFAQKKGAACNLCWLYIDAKGENTSNL